MLRHSRAPIGLISVIVLLLVVACDVEGTPTPGSSSSGRTTATSSSSSRAATATPTNSSGSGLGIVGAPQSSAATATPVRSLDPAPTATENPVVMATVSQSPADVPDHIVQAIADFGEAYRVDRIVDGDTIDVVIGGVVSRVRLIGMDTPEVHGGVECFGRESSARTEELIAQAGWQVFLEKDVSETDRFGRLLRYVWLPHDDGLRMLNYELVAGGYAQVATYPPDVKHTEWFLEAQRGAAEAGHGLWTGCAEPEPTPTPQPIATPVPTTAPPPPTSNCDPSYPTVCIPPYPPDLDCGDIPYRRFQVLPPDPHGFDRDRDGIGCES